MLVLVDFEDDGFDGGVAFDEDAWGVGVSGGGLEEVTSLDGEVGTLPLTALGMVGLDVFAMLVLTTESLERESNAHDERIGGLSKRTQKLKLFTLFYADSDCAGLKECNAKKAS